MTNIINSLDQYCFMDNIYRMFEEVEEELKFITTSGVRAKMMISLLKKPKTSTQLKDELEAGASTIIHAARDLEKEGFLIEKIDGYHLTGIGKILTIKLIDWIKLVSVVKENKDYWITHNIDVLPKEFLERMGELQKLKIIKSTPTNLLQVLSLYIKMVGKTKELKGTSPVFVPQFSTLVKKLLKKKGIIQLVISKEILNPVIESYRKGVDEEIKKRVEAGNLRIWVIDDIKIAMSVTDLFISIGFFNNDGTYDFSQDLVSYEKEAIEWGRELFEYYKSRAKEVKLN